MSCWSANLAANFLTLLAMSGHGLDWQTPASQSLAHCSMYWYCSFAVRYVSDPPHLRLPPVILSGFSKLYNQIIFIFLVLSFLAIVINYSLSVSYRLTYSFTLETAAAFDVKSLSKTISKLSLSSSGSKRVEPFPLPIVFVIILAVAGITTPR